MPRHPLRPAVIAVLLGAALFASGCTGPVGHMDLAASWTTRDMLPIRQPVAVDGVFVTLVTTDKKVWAEGLDAASGALLWRKESRASDHVDVSPLGVEHDAKNVFLLAPADVSGEPFATVQAVVARTGQQVWHSTTARIYTETPHLCRDDQHALCLMEQTDDKHTAFVRINAADGTETSTPTDRYFFGTNTGLYMGLGKSGVAVLASSPVAKPGSWQVDIGDVFPGGHSGWTAARDDAHKLFLVYWGLPGAYYRGDSAAVAIDSGKRLWTAPGVIHNCSDHVPATVGQGAILDCRYHQAAGSKEPDDAVVEARDPARGHILWSFDAGNALHDGLPGPKADQLGEHGWLITDAVGHRTALDVTTGKTQPADPHRIGWCVNGGDTFTVAGSGDGTSGADEYRPDWAIYPCAIDGTPTTALPDFIPDAMSSPEGKTYAWSDGKTIHTAQRS